jgi:hypothetical protein
MLLLVLWSKPPIQVHRVIILWSLHWSLHVLQSKKSQKCMFPSSFAPVSRKNLDVSSLILTSSIKLAWHSILFNHYTVIFCHFILNKAFASTVLNILHGYSCYFKLTAWLKNSFLWCSISNCYLLQFVHFGCQLSDLLAKYLHTLFCTNDHWSINTLVSSGF